MTTMTAAKSISTSPEVRQPLGASVGIPPRRVSLKLDETQPTYWYGNDPFLTHFWAGFSLLLPHGEDFFVEAVRHYRGQITDPQLKAAISGFIGQEALHSQGHQVLNKFLQDKNLPAEKIEAQLKVMLDLVAKIHPRFNLAATICLEHFTAIIAEQLLRDEEHHGKGQGEVLSLWLWHALEETEHKAVAYDVWDQTGGNYAVRAGTMIPTVVILSAFMSYTVGRMLLADGQLFKVKQNVRGLNYLFGRKGLLTRLTPQFLDWFRPSFHPNDHDTTALVAEWREKLFGAKGELNYMLKGKVTH